VFTAPRYYNMMYIIWSLIQAPRFSVNHVERALPDASRHHMMPIMEPDPDAVAA
jgi:hypothetical protein